MTRDELKAALQDLIERANYNTEQEPDILMAITALEYIHKGLRSALRMDGIFTAILKEAKAQITRG